MPAATTAIPLKPSPNPRNAHPQLPDLTAIISGGQCGVDQAGLRAAHALGLSTGGFAPLDFKTQLGRNPQLGNLYGLVEDVSPDYPRRTTLNVFHSDATIRIAEDFGSPGERCTLKAIKKYGKPRFDVEVHFLDGNRASLRAIAHEGISDVVAGLVPLHELFRRFLTLHQVKILNCAGNSERTCAGIGQVAEAFLLEALTSC